MLPMDAAMTSLTPEEIREYLSGLAEAIAQRPQDLRDIDGLLDVHPDADVDGVRQWVRESSSAMAMPDLLEGFEKLVAQREPQPHAPQPDSDLSMKP